LQPQLLLLDESLSALDIQTRHEVARELREILLRLKLTTVMVSHQYSDALNFADHIIVLEQGRVIQEGAHLDLLRHPRSSYIAEMVGVNRFEGTVVSVDKRAGTCRVSLLDGEAPVVEIEAAPGDPLDRGSEVSVILHPRRVTLHTADPAGVTATCRRHDPQRRPQRRLLGPRRALSGLVQVVMDFDARLPRYGRRLGRQAADAAGRAHHATFCRRRQGVSRAGPSPPGSTRWATYVSVWGPASRHWGVRSRPLCVSSGGADRRAAHAECDLLRENTIVVTLQRNVGGVTSGPRP
jgi:hypothetical protein